MARPYEPDTTEAATRPGTAGAGQVPAEAYQAPNHAIGSDYLPGGNHRPAPPRYAYDPRRGNASYHPEQQQGTTRPGTTTTPGRPPTTGHTYTHNPVSTAEQAAIRRQAVVMQSIRSQFGLGLPGPQLEEGAPLQVWWGTSTAHNAYGPETGSPDSFGYADDTETQADAYARVDMAFASLSDPNDTEGHKFIKHLYNILDHYYPAYWNPSFIGKAWVRAVDRAANAYTHGGYRIDPVTMFENMAGMGEFDQFFGRSNGDQPGSSGGGGGYYGGGWGGGWGGGGWGGGGGGGGGGGAGSVSLTNPDSARGLVSQAMQQYLGRAPTGDEIKEFTKALNRAEMNNPVMVDASGNVTVQSGGVDPGQRAIEYAQKQDDYAEFQVAGNYVDAFIQALANPVQGV